MNMSHTSTMPEAPKNLVLPKPRPEVAPEVVPMPFAKRHQVKLRAIRVLLTFLVLGLMAFAYINYGLYTVPGDKGREVFFGIAPGDSLVIARYRFWRSPQLGDVVFYNAPGAASDQARLIGRVSGLPGERIARRGPTMAIGGREPMAVGFELGDSARIRDGDVIPEGKYLILVDSDAVTYADSREHGYIPLDSIEYRLALNLAAFWGRK